MSIHISYFLGEHGWSTCWLYVDEVPYEISISQAAPTDPINDLFELLIGIINGEKEQALNWYSEPGGVQIVVREIPTKRHMVSFQLFEFQEDWGETPNIPDRENPQIAFEIKKIQLIRMLYFEFKKISELLKDKHYQQNRMNEFPSQQFTEFELKALDFITL